MMLSCLGLAGGLAAEAKGGDIADVGHTGAARDTGPGAWGRPRGRERWGYLTNCAEPQRGNGGEVEI